MVERITEMPAGTVGFRVAVFALMIPGEARVFETAGLESAKQWVAGDAS